MRLKGLRGFEKAKVGNLLRTGNAYVNFFLDMDHETQFEWIKLELGNN